VQYIRFERSYEDFHTNANNIFRITTDIYNGKEFVITDCETYAPLGPLMKERMPEVVDYVRFYGMDGLKNVKSASHSFLETGLYWADASAFRIFTYDVIHGDAKRALTAPFDVVITASMAAKYFGRTDVIDEMLEIDRIPYRVKAVIADLPANTHLKFSFLLSRLSLKTLKPWYPDDRWNNNNEFTYVLTVPGTNLGTFNQKLEALTITELKGEIDDERFTAESIQGIHLHSNKSYEPEANGSAQVVYYFTLIAAFIIVIAWVNYINLSTARAVERAREVGIRKVMGSVKRHLILQFLNESVIVNLIAGLLALVLFQISFPLLRDLSGQPLNDYIWNDRFFWLLFGGLIAGGSLLSGIYPAFVLASFKPAEVLKGKFHSSSHGQLLRKGLVIFQFSTTVILLISLVTIYRQIRFMQQYDLGMNIDQTLVLTGSQINTPDSLFHVTSQTLKSELLKNPEVSVVSNAETLPGQDIQDLSTTSLRRIGDTNDGKDGYQYYLMSVDSDFVPAMGMTLAAGRNFAGDKRIHDQVLINEEAAKLLGFGSAEEAIGMQINFQTRDGSTGSTVIGVLKDFHFRSPKEPYLPMLFFHGGSRTYFALKVNTKNMERTLANVKKTWDTILPNTVFHYFFLDERYDQQYRADAQFGKVMAAFAGLILFIACLGLFGLSSYTITQRTKEIGIRKVLGASVTAIVRLLTMGFAKTVLLAGVIALPVAYFLMKEWLTTYSVHIDLNAWIFVMALALILLLAIITVSFQVIRTAVANPTDSLKHE